MKKVKYKILDKKINHTKINFNINRYFQKYLVKLKQAII